MKRVFEQAKRGYNRRFCYVLRCHRYLMVPLDQVYVGEVLAAVELVGQVQDAGQGVTVMGGGKVEASEPVFLNVYGAQESIPRNKFRQPL
jgi:hypothetical protein